MQAIANLARNYLILVYCLLYIAILYHILRIGYIAVHLRHAGHRQRGTKLYYLRLLYIINRNIILHIIYRISYIILYDAIYEIQYDSAE